MKRYGSYNIITEMPEDKQERENIIIGNAKVLMKAYENMEWQTLSIIVKKPGEILNPFDSIKDEETGEIIPYWTIGIKVEIDEG